MEKLPLSLKIRYGAADLGIALITSVTQFFLLFYYTDVAGINPAIAGTALLVGKLTWDAINDPLIGYLSDRTRSRFGRRRVYMFCGAIPLALTAWLLLSLPQGLTGAAAFLAVFVTFLLMDTFHTLVSVPYYAMTPELTYDYNERGSLTSIRMVYSVIGYILGAATTTVIAGLLVSQTGLTLRGAWSGTGLIFGAIAAITVLFTALSVRERHEAEVKLSKMPPLKAVRSTFHNRPFNIMLVIFFISSFSFTLLTALVPYFIIYQLKMKEAVPIVLLIMLLAIMIFLIPAQMLSKRINKGPAYALGLLIASLAIMATFFLPPAPTPLIYLIAFVAGMGFSGQWVFPWSMIPDVIEYDQYQTGERREGIYYGIWALLQKFTNAFGLAVSGWALAWFGYVANAEQTPQALFGIRLFFSLVPALLLLITLPMLVRFPITRQSHAEMLEKLRQRGEVAYSEDLKAAR